MGNGLEKEAELTEKEEVFSVARDNATVVNIQYLTVMQRSFEVWEVMDTGVNEEAIACEYSCRAAELQKSLLASFTASHQRGLFNIKGTESVALFRI